jgi:phage protein D
MTTPVNDSTAVGPVIYNVYVNGVLQTTPQFILDAELNQTWGSHDVFVFRVEYNRNYPMNTIKPWPDNAPVMVSWGRKPQGMNTWYGYVNHHKTSGNADSGTHNLQLTYFCIGTSKPMNSVDNQFWGSVTPTYIAKQIARQHHLRCVVTSTSWLLSSEVQANESDFQFMNRIASKTGFRFWVSGGTLYLVDPAVVLVGAGQTTVPTYAMDKRLYWQDTIRNFSKLQGDNLPGAPVATRSVFGVDTTTGKLVQARAGTGSIQQHSTTRVATSLGEAQQHVQAWHNLSQWWIAATAELFGNVSLYPGKVVNLTGNGMLAGDQGTWLVSSARHLMKMSGTGYTASDKYVTQVALTRNASGPQPAVKGAVRITPEIVGCALSSGVWYSTSGAVITDGVIA